MDRIFLHPRDEQGRLKLPTKPQENLGQSVREQFWAARKALGQSEQQITAGWIQYLTSLAGGAPQG